MVMLPLLVLFGMAYSRKTSATDAWVRPYIGKLATRYLVVTHAGHRQYFKETVVVLKDVKVRKAQDAFLIAHDKTPSTDPYFEYYRYYGMGDGWFDSTHMTMYQKDDDTEMVGQAPFGSQLYYFHFEKLGWLQVMWLRVRSGGTDPFRPAPVPDLIKKFDRDFGGYFSP